MGTRQLQRVVDQVAVVQIDSVNVLARSQYLPFFARLGTYDTALLDRFRDRAPRRLVEYWAHEASLVAPSTHRLLQWRMERWRDNAWGGMRRVAAEHPALVDQVLAEVAARGPVTAVELEKAMAHDQPRDRGDWGWNWSLVKQALESLFWAGEITSAGRSSQFARRYDVPHRVLPTGLQPPPDASESLRQLVSLSARAVGVGSEQCLRDYFRLGVDDTRTAVAELVEAGVLLPVAVPGWRQPAYLHRAARLPRRVTAATLISPFDPLIWERGRTERLFG
ncbi:MAG TPA: crosslink repair DNA glycosylase YcaQ family protein, partial [Actinomycetales bacterium]